VNCKEVTSIIHCDYNEKKMSITESSFPCLNSGNVSKFLPQTEYVTHAYYRHFYTVLALSALHRSYEVMHLVSKHFVLHS
jgi:hypothetical protein